MPLDRIKALLGAWGRFTTPEHRVTTPEHRAFNESRYLAANPDIMLAIKKGEFRSALAHYVSYGRKEIALSKFRRFPFELRGFALDYDEQAYLEDNVDVMAMVSSGRYPNGFEHFLAAGYTECLEGLRSPYSSHRSARLIETRPGNCTPSPRKYVCIFAHYSQNNVIDEYVLRYLAELKRLGIDIYFVTATSDRDELAKIPHFVVGIFIKNDAGRDFGSWYLALNSLTINRLEQYEYLILANDSVYFPVAPAAEMFRAMELRKLNFWGITDSYDLGRYHIQSYFLSFDRAARNSVLRTFLTDYEKNLYLTKWGQLVEYEFQFATQAMEAGLSVGAFCPIDEIQQAVTNGRLSLVLKNRNQSFEFLNPTHILWEPLISVWHCPVLKQELLRTNPLNVDITKWKNVIDSKCLDPEIISNHLDSITPTKTESKAMVSGNGRACIEQRGQIDGQGWVEGQRAAVFAHFDPDNVVDDHVVHAMRSLRDAECAVVFVTSTDSARELGRILPYCASVLIKNDAGWDFGSWHLAMKTYLNDLKRYRNVIWLNDSIYFPLFGLHEIFSAMDEKNVDFWGLVDSYKIRWHIKKWLWTFGPKIVNSDWFNWYAREFNPNFSKWDQIKNYEQAIPQFFRNHGYKTDVHVSVDLLRSHATHIPARQDSDLTHEYWDILIKDLRCPALEVKLVRDNPLGIDPAKFFTVIENNTRYDTQLIKAHLQRSRTTGRIPSCQRSEQKEYRNASSPSGTH